MTLKEVVCPACNTTFEIQLKKFNEGIKKNYRHCCSKVCHAKLRYTSVELPCRVCNKTVHRTNSQFKKSKSGYIFCSKSCSTSYNNSQHRQGAKNHRWNPGGWRKSVKKESCSRCGYNDHPEILQIHHKDRDRKNNKLDNLEVLCPNCHLLDHFNNQDGLYNQKR